MGESNLLYPNKAKIDESPLQFPFQSSSNQFVFKKFDILRQTPRDLVFILRQRAEFALHPRSWSEEILEIIAELAEGNARVAIQTLKNAGYIAENDFSREIKEKHVEQGYNSAKDLKKTYLLNKLTEHHRLLYGLVKERGEIQSGELWELYLKKCKSLNRQPIALRTFSEYMNKLIELDLVRGKVRVFKIG